MPRSASPPPPHKAGAWTTALLGGLALLTLPLADAMTPAVILVGVLAAAATLVAIARALPLPSSRVRALRPELLAGANALLGAAMLALPLVLGLRGRYVLFPLALGMLIAAFAGASLLMALDQAAAPGAVAARDDATATAPRERPSRARPGG